MKNKIVIAATLFVFLVVGIFFVRQTNRSQSGNPNLSTQPTSNGSQQNTAPLTKPAPSTENDKNLEECFKRVSNSEARQEIINEGLQACRDKYR